MLYIAIIALFVLAVTALLIAIKYSKHTTLTFFLIPMLLASSVISYYAFKSLEGSPIDGYPTEKFAVLATHVEKPSIIILIRLTETNEIKTHKIPFNKRSASDMNREQSLTQNGIARNGRFEENKFGEMRYFVERDPTALPPKATPK